jgi:hypothetical protein
MDYLRGPEKNRKKDEKKQAKIKERENRTNA